MKPITHIAISASAGSGKTFQLADRFVHLLANGVAPDRIAALTFSRKAAGEIFDRVVLHLCEACRSPEAATEVAARIGCPNQTSTTFTRALRALMDNLPRLHIGTLDSFIVGVLKAFPTEIGVPPDFRMMDENSSDAMQMRERVLDRIFNPLALEASIQTAFFEAFKQATFGTEDKDMERSLHNMIERYRSYYQVLPNREAWGEESQIWPHGSRWLPPVHDVAASAQTLKDLIDAQGWPVRFRDGLLRVVDACAAHTPASRWDSTITRSAVMRGIMEQLDDLAEGRLTLTYSKADYPFDPVMCKHLDMLIRHFLGVEIRSALSRTSGIYRLITLFETHYDTLMRRTGTMTFADAQYLLTESNRYNQGASLSRMANAEGRLYIDYRLDCRLDHWLLDEFQDTSDLQWAVMHNLIDEILQDASQSRSFFYVGDVKQAIYGWRGGNPSLFGDILTTYADRIEEQPLTTSYRSCPPVIDTVNALFDALPPEALDARVDAQWQRTWHRHDCAPHLCDAAGYATVIEPQCQEGQAKPTTADRHALVGALLREINPVQRGLTTAILVRRNTTGHELVEQLRQSCPDIPVSMEGKASLRENAVVELFLSLIAFAAHPGDRFAWRHIEMSPLNDYLTTAGLTAFTLPRHLLDQIHTLGFAGFIRTWSNRLADHAPLNAFASHCIRDLVEAAIQFDRSSERDPDTFRRFIENYTLPSTSAPDTVRVMTVHQSKGLGFDIVILPELNGDDIRRDSRQSALVNREADTGHPDWLLALSNRTVAEADPTLSATLEQHDHDACFENLCVLYVAATRAKCGLYAVTSFAGPTAKSFTAAEFVKTQLADHEAEIMVDDTPATRLYECGTHDWFTAHPPVERPAPPTQPAPESSRILHSAAALQRLEPSASDTTPRRAAWLFQETAREVLAFGSAIHALFEKIEWVEHADIAAITSEWQAKTDAPAQVAHDAITQFKRAVAAPEIRAALTQPKGPAQLWREKRFHYVQEGALVSGAFDRVVIQLDHGLPTAATVLDFKSDQVSSADEIHAAVERHREQLTLYRSALSHILSITPESITCQLLFTRPVVIRNVETSA